jgi:hypothetical protein
MTLPNHQIFKESLMPNPAVQAIIDAANQARSVEESAVAYIQGVPALIDAAVQAALSNGATDAELAPLTQLSADLTASNAAVLAALAANTPLSPAQLKSKK